MSNEELVANYRAKYEEHKKRLDDYFTKHPKARKSGQIKVLLRNMELIKKTIEDLERSAK